MWLVIKRFWWLFTKYKLSKDEFDTWIVIVCKAEVGFEEWKKKGHGKPEIVDLTSEEWNLLTLIYSRFFTVTPELLGENVVQDAYSKYELIKNRVFY